MVVTGIEVKTSSSHVSVGGHGTQGGQQQPQNSELLSVDTWARFGSLGAPSFT